MSDRLGRRAVTEMLPNDQRSLVNMLFSIQRGTVLVRAWVQVVHLLFVIVLAI